MKVYPIYIAEDDNDNPLCEKGFEVLSVPYIGEVIYLNTDYLAVVNVIHNIDENKLLLVLGEACETAEDARLWFKDFESEDDID